MDATDGATYDSTPLGLARFLHEPIQYIIEGPLSRVIAVIDRQPLDCRTPAYSIRAMK